MSQACESTKKSRQKLSSLITRGGIRQETPPCESSHNPKADKRQPQTHSVWMSYHNYGQRSSVPTQKLDQPASHIHFENADDTLDQKTMSSFRALNKDLNSTNHRSKELIQVKEESSESSGDERLSRAFGIERSLTMTPRVKSYQLSSSFGAENPEIEQSMLTDELRMMSFLNEDEDELDRQFEIQKNKFKNRMQKNGLMSRIQAKNLRNFEVGPGKLATSQRKTEASLFSTQDSRKHFSSSFTQQHESTNNQNLSAHLAEVVDPDVSYKLHSATKPRMNSEAGAEMHFDYVDTEPLHEGGARGYNAFSSTLQRDPKFYYDFYMPGVDMDMMHHMGKLDNRGSMLGDGNRVSEDHLSHQKSGKRNYLRVDDSNEFLIKVEKIEVSRKTTLMIKNIPNKYTKELMLEAIDECFHDAYDFFYLPIDFKNNCNVGYAFINFKELGTIRAFYEKFNNRKWAKFNSEKVCEIKYARIQGKEECESHFKGSSLMKQPVS